MALTDDVNAGLADVSAPDAPAPLLLDDDGRCEIRAPLPPGLDGLPDQVTVMVSVTHDVLTLRSPLAAIDGELGQAAGAALLRRHLFSEQASGVTYALADADGALVAVYHWVLDHISVSDFRRLVAHFITAWVDMVREVAAMAVTEPSLRVL